MKKIVKPYLISITTEGIKNITKPITVRFYKKKSLKDFNPSFDNVRAIYGANGSGKSAFMTSMWLLRELLTSKDAITLLGNEYFHNVLNKENPIFTISVDYALLLKNKKDDDYQIDKIYRYFIRVDGTNKSDIKITDEGLDMFSGQYEKSKILNVFACKDGKVISLLDYANKESLSIDLNEIIEKSLNILSKQTFVTFLKDYMLEMLKKDDNKLDINDDIQNLLSTIYFALALKIRLANDNQHHEYFESSENRIQNIIELTNNELKNALSYQTFDKIADKIIVRKENYQEFEEHIKKQTKFVQLFKPDLKSIDIDKIEAKDFYLCSRTMNYGIYSISFEFEGSGIKRLLSIYNYLNDASKGEIVFIDEIDANISGVYLQKIVEFLTQYGKGQLCFTAHSLDPMYVLNEFSKSIYFINDNGEILSWTKNANYKPYILYPEGMIRGIPFLIEKFDFVEIFDF